MHYAPGALQFGDLRMPELVAGTNAPLVVFVHGGWWKAEYGLDYGGHLCEALRTDGIATWSLEYRRVGDPGGGWPGTFEDVAAGFDFIRTLSKTGPIDLDRVVTMGHSAGGHLAFWLAGRHHIPDDSPLAHLRAATPMRAAIALAGVVGLRMTIDLSGFFTFAHDKQEILNFMGAAPGQAPDRYRAGDPAELLPLSIPQFLLQGAEDDQIPPQLPLRWAERARRLGDTVTLDRIPGADHFDIVDPQSAAWPRVRATVLKALA